MISNAVPTFWRLTLALSIACSFPLGVIAGDVNAQSGTVTVESTPPVQRKKVFLALGGGGLRGFAHAGVLKVLEREKIPIDGVVGTSMGAIIGGLYCAGIKPSELELEGPRKFVKAFFTAPLLLQAMQAPLLMMTGKSPQGLYTGTKAAKSINSAVTDENREIGNLKRKFIAVATDLLSGHTYLIDHGNLGKALQASSAVPFLRRPVQLDGKLLVDGGVVCNLPVNEARANGADIVIAVDIDEGVEPIPEAFFRKRLGSVTNRSISLVLAKIDGPQGAAADVYIHPDTTGIALFSRSDRDAKRAIAAGEEAAIQALPAIRAKIAASQ